MAGSYYWDKEVKEHLDSLPRGKKSQWINENLKKAMQNELNPQSEQQKPVVKSKIKGVIQ